MKGINTKLVNSGPHTTRCNGIEVKTINPPVHHASTVLFDTYADLQAAHRGEYHGVSYGTAGVPVQRSFEKAMTALEGGTYTKAFQSGINAITTALMAFTRSGDHILVVDNVYGPTRRFCDRTLAKFGVRTEYLPSAVGSDVANYIRPDTSLIFLESPGSNTFEIQDIPAITAVARKMNIVTIIDNTWATPLFLKPFELGVDIIIQSVTKYISGHSDILLGTVTVNARQAEAFKRFCRTMELYASPDDCYLALRGLKTLAIRLRHHEAAALEVANWLVGLDIVEHVLHPALPGHPQHDLWRRDFSGSNGLFAFIFKQAYPENQIAAFVNALELFGLGFSWGGYKSLMTVDKYLRTASSDYSGRTVFRINIGMEDAPDLIADLENGLKYLVGHPEQTNA
ncbi:MAG: cystathionine beta-lyase [Desulfobacterales bacterium]|nr:cystathionine beta-lyase [Desulfobacterales bacterium]